MHSTYITDPLNEPVLLDELKDHLRLDGAAEDAGLGAFITTARTLIEQHADLVLVNRDIALYLDRWPRTSAAGGDVPWWAGTASGAMSLLDRAASTALLPVRPVSSVASIAVVAPDDSETVWAADNYQLTPGLSSRITLVSGRRWPVPGRAADGIKITLTAGFGPSWNSVPASVRQAVLMLASYLYANRGDARSDGSSGAIIASGAASLLAPYRERRL